MIEENKEPLDKTNKDGHKFFYCLILAFGTTIFAFLLGKGGGISFLLALFSPFIKLYLLALLTISLGFVIIKKKSYAIITILITTAIAFFHLPIKSPAVQVTSSGQQTLKAIFLNLHVDNYETDELFQLIDQVDPDFIGLTEVGNFWGTELLLLKENYPFYKIVPTGAFGVAAFSKYPMDEVEVLEFVDNKFALDVSVRLPKQKLRYVVCHAPPPLTKEKWIQRNDYLAALANTVKESKDPVIVMGDFNITPFSPIYGLFLEEAKLRDTRSSYLFQNSWPTSSSIQAIPIDHIWIDKRLKIKGFEVLENVNSDHYPILLNFFAVDT